MRSKLSWILFIPLMAAACFLKLAQELFPEGTILGLKGLQLEYLYLAAVALIFFFALLFCLLDRKTAAYYLPHRNFPAGIVGLVLAVLLAGDGANALFHAFSAGKIDVLAVLDAVLSLLSAIVFIVLGLNHSFRNRESKRLSLFYVMPALLCAIRMIISFVAFTTISIRLADVGRLVCYVFATLFFYRYAVMLSLIKTKNTVKLCFVFGFPAVAALIPYGVFQLIFRFDAQVILNNIQPAEMLLLGLYILCFLIELTVFVCDKDSVTLVEEEEAVIDLSEEKVEGLLASNEAEDEKDSDVDTSYLESRDIEGFLYQETKQDDENPEVSEDAKKDVAHYLTEVQEDTTDDDENKPKDYEDRLDEIDKLILDITSQSD